MPCLGRLTAGRDLVRFGNRSDSSGGVDALAAVATAYGDRCGRMDTDPDRRGEPVLTAVVGKCSLDSDCAFERGDWLGEGDEEAVTRVVDLLAPIVGEQSAKHPIVPLDEVKPGLVADRLDETRRPTDVGEEKGGRGGGGTARLL